MTSSSGNIFRVTGSLWGKPLVTGGRPMTQSFAVFFLSPPEQTAEQTIEMLVICDAMALIMTSL